MASTPCEPKNCKLGSSTSFQTSRSFHQHRSWSPGLHCESDIPDEDMFDFPFYPAVESCLRHDPCRAESNTPSRSCALRAGVTRCVKTKQRESHCGGWACVGGVDMGIRPAGLVPSRPVGQVADPDGTAPTGVTETPARHARHQRWQGSASWHGSYRNPPAVQTPSRQICDCGGVMGELDSSRSRIQRRCRKNQTIASFSQH